MHSETKYKCFYTCQTFANQPTKTIFFKPFYIRANLLANEKNMRIILGFLMHLVAFSVSELIGLKIIEYKDSIFVIIVLYSTLYELHEFHRRLCMWWCDLGSYSWLNNLRANIAVVLNGSLRNLKLKPTILLFH